MKYPTIAALLAAQILTAAQPAHAAELTEHRTQQMGAFAGVRLRMPLDGDARQRQLRAGFAVAPAMHSRAMNGESRLAIGEGLEVGIVGRQPVRLRLAGQDIRRLGAAQDDETEEDDGHHGPSTLGWIAISVGALVVVVGVAGALAIDHILDCERSEDPGC